ncbi:hypothetical protein GGF44_003768 [Coemansia sp. RSA 1694]|nr:hypothetical protein GGF44_003768 [Coemansia sp. RSA 1694]
MERAFTNSGYKYGVDASKTDHMQVGFDQGFDLALQYGRAIGTVLGALLAQRSIRKKLELPEENIDALVMRLRAITHKSIFQSQYLTTPDPTPEAELPADMYTRWGVDGAGSTLGDADDWLAIGEVTEGAGATGAGIEEEGIAEGAGATGAGIEGDGIAGDGTAGAGIEEEGIAEGAGATGAGIEEEGTAEGAGAIGAGMEGDGIMGDGTLGAGLVGDILVYLGAEAVEALGVAIGAVDVIGEVADAVGTGEATRWSAHPDSPPDPLIATSGQAVAPSSKLPKSAGSRARSCTRPPTGIAALSEAEMSESVMNLIIPTIVIVNY